MLNYNNENIVSKVSKTEASRKSILNEVMAPSAGQIVKAEGEKRARRKRL